MNLYFIAIVPPEEIRVEIQHLKEEMKERFGAEHALKLPAHITLVPPFELKEERELQLLQSLELFSATRKPFHLWLSGFGNFPPQVLFVEIVEKEKIRDLHQSLRENLSVIPEIPDKKNLHPHVTIATRDLEEALFPAARDFLSNHEYESRFEVTGFSLFKHKGKEWEIFMDFGFSKS